MNLRTIVNVLFFIFVSNLRANNVITEVLDSHFTIVTLPFYANELIEYCRLDTLYLESKIIADKDRQNSDIKPHDLYINDYCVNALIDSLKLYKNEFNAKVVDSLIQSLPQHKPLENGFKWDDIYHTGYDYDYYVFDDYVLFSLLYKGDSEIKPLVEIANGELWKDGVLEDFKHGEKIVTPTNASNRKIRALEEKIISYLIKKWSLSEKSYAHELISALEASMSYLNTEPTVPESYLNGTWTGKIDGKEIIVYIEAKYGIAHFTYNIKGMDKCEKHTRYFDYGSGITSDLYKENKSSFGFILQKENN